jgi:hypothetical protein
MQSNRAHREACRCEACRNNHPFEIPDDLYEDFVEGNVVIFAGAGVSTESPQVFPYKFLDEIRDELEGGIAEGSLFPDVMTSYCTRPNGRAKLLRRIRKRLSYVQSFPQLYRRATRFHRELSTIPFIDSIVTTNGDTYFERECGAVPFVSAEDYAFAEIPGRKVFKIHGSIDSYGSIIATREDYERCYESLQTGLLGSTLKLFLATKTVVYIGFSFADDDFIRIFDALTSEMRGLRPHSYIVTLAKPTQNHLLEKGLTPICTDGTFFISKIKERLVADGHMLDDGRLDGVERLLARVLQIHYDELSEISIRKYPDNIFGLCYQDGLIDCLERILGLAKTGEYSLRERVLKVAKTYEFQIRPRKLKNRRYQDVAYIDGYVNGLLHLLADNEVRKVIPIYYAFGHRGPISNLTRYMRALRKSNSSSRAEHRWALQAARKLPDKEEHVFHHTPFLC